MKKVLVIQLGPFGDALLTTSYFETLKRRLSAAKLYYLVKEPYHKILKDHPFIDNLIIIKKQKGLRYISERIKIIRKIHREKFDLVIDQQNMPSSQQITFFSHAKFRLGYADARLSFVYNLKAQRGKKRYSASSKYDILGPLEIKEEPYKLYFNIGKDSCQYVEKWLEHQNINKQEYVCISPGSPVKRKKWKLTNYAELADLIQEKTRYNIVLLWGPREFQDIETIRSRMKTEPIIAPATDLNQAAALLKKCKLLICNDGGLNHLAVATETPTLAIFGNTDPEVWSPASVFPRHHHLYIAGFNSENDNSFGISPEMAYEEVQRILKYLDLKVATNEN